MDKLKRERSANFTLNEIDILTCLIQKYQGVLENKQSDGSTWKQKEATWELLQKEFKPRSGGIFRSVKTLKVKYEGLKLQVRKKSAAIRSELYRTGGGTNTAPPLDNVEERIKTLIKLSAEGLESFYDSDVLPQTEENHGSPNKMETLQQEEVPTEITFITNQNDLESSIIINETLNTDEEKSVTIVTNDCATSTSFMDKIDPDIQVQMENYNINDNILQETPTRKHINVQANSEKKWDVTSRKKLKSRKHPALNANFHKKPSFDELTQAKLELVQLQKELIQAEIIEKKKEWEFNEKERKWKEEEYKLKLDKLKRELNE